MCRKCRHLRRNAGTFAGKRLHLVQFAGPIKPEWVDALEQNGARVVTYIPQNAYLVYGDARGIGANAILGAHHRFRPLGR